MSEWKELEVDNLPPDILTGNYEFQQYKHHMWWPQYFDEEECRHYMLRDLYSGSVFRYLKPEPKQPTHEEIMTKWWFIKEANCWCKVIAYKQYRYLLSPIPDLMFKDIPTITRGREYFIFSESADIPPE